MDLHWLTKGSIPTSARRKIEKKTTSQSPAKALLIQWAQWDLALANDKGKQINKQTRSSTCRGVDAGGSTVVAQSMESTMQCVRVCGRASKMFGEVWSSVCKVVL